MKQIKIKINDKITECKVIEEYTNDKIRIQYPTYCNGKYNGYEEITINKSEVLK